MIKVFQHHNDSNDLIQFVACVIVFCVFFLISIHEYVN